MNYGLSAIMVNADRIMHETNGIGASKHVVKQRALKVVGIVFNYLGLSIEDRLITKGDENNSEAKRISMRIIGKLYRPYLSLNDIAGIYETSHCNILHHIKVAKNRYDTYKDKTDLYDHIELEVKQKLGISNDESVKTFNHHA